MVKDLRKCFDELNWKWAKTYEKFAHHWYCTRLECKYYLMFDFLLQVIEFYGKDEVFMGKEYRYYKCNGYKYWLTTINRPKMILMNKAKI